MKDQTFQLIACIARTSINQLVQNPSDPSAIEDRQIQSRLTILSISSHQGSNLPGLSITSQQL